MAKPYFFTDPSLLDVQSTGQAYGPASSTEFHLSSKHTVSSGQGAPVIACVGGLLYAQEQSSTLLNLVIKPFNHNPHLPFRVKYFVYRGVAKSSLVQGSGAIVLTTANDLAAQLHENQAAYADALGVAKVDPTEETLGLHFTASATGDDQKLDSEKIDALFFNHLTAFKPTRVRAGQTLGEFAASSEIGFEIVLEAYGSNPTLGELRASDGLVTVTAAPTIATPQDATDALENRAAREKVIHYIDPAAFYGLHARSGVRVLQGSTVSTLTDQDLYTDVLTKFAHPGRVYLDIRNENSYSLNYYSNYSSYAGYNVNVNLSFDGNTAPSGRAYLSNDWPIHIIEGSELSSGVANSKTHIRLSLPEADNTKPLVYLDGASPYKRFPEVPRHKARYIEPTFTSGWTDEIELATAAAGSNSIASYVKLSYIQRIDPEKVAPPKSSPVINANYYLDNTFVLPEVISDVIPWDFSESSKPRFQTANLHYQRFVDGMEELGFSGFVSTVLVVEEDKIHYLLSPTEGFKWSTLVGPEYNLTLPAFSDQNNFLRNLESSDLVLSPHQVPSLLGLQHLFVFSQLDQDGILTRQVSIVSLEIDSQWIADNAVEISSLTANWHVAYYNPRARSVHGVGWKLVDPESSNEYIGIWPYIQNEGQPNEERVIFVRIGKVYVHKPTYIYNRLPNEDAPMKDYTSIEFDPVDFLEEQCKEPLDTESTFEYLPDLATATYEGKNYRIRYLIDQIEVVDTFEEIAHDLLAGTFSLSVLFVENFANDDDIDLEKINNAKTYIESQGKTFLKDDLNIVEGRSPWVHNIGQRHPTEKVNDLLAKKSRDGSYDYPAEREELIGTRGLSILKAPVDNLIQLSIPFSTNGGPFPAFYLAKEGYDLIKDQDLGPALINLHSIGGIATSHPLLNTNIARYTVYHELGHVAGLKHTLHTQMGRRSGTSSQQFDEVFGQPLSNQRLYYLNKRDTEDSYELNQNFYLSSPPSVPPSENISDIKPHSEYNKNLTVGNTDFVDQYENMMYPSPPLTAVENRRFSPIQFKQMFDNLIAYRYPVTDTD